MTRHPFQPLAAVLGVVVVVAGVVVAAFGVERIDPTLTIAAVAATLGLLVIPWRGRDTPAPGSDAAPSESTDMT